MTTRRHVAIRGLSALALAFTGACQQVVTESGDSLTETQLRYRLADRYELFYCDPDYWPVGRGDEAELALERFPAIMAEAERFAAILEQLGLSGQSEFTDEQKLAIYRESKRIASILLQPSGSDYTFALRSQEGDRYYHVSGGIDIRGKISEREKQRTSDACPICLPGDTRIATAHGEMRVSDIAVGTLVWSQDAQGQRVLVPTLRTARAPLSGRYHLIRLRLEDGRTVVGSPPHPTADGRRLADLAPGDTIGGSRVREVERTVQELTATYDLLPASATGVYWGNDIPLGTTIQRHLALTNQ